MVIDNQLIHLELETLLNSERDLLNCMNKLSKEELTIITIQTEEVLSKKNFFERGIFYLFRQEEILKYNYAKDLLQNYS
jgi:hypothetical protein